MVVLFSNYTSNQLCIIWFWRAGIGSANGLPRDCNTVTPQIRRGGRWSSMELKTPHLRHQGASLANSSAVGSVTTPLGRSRVQSPPVSYRIKQYRHYSGTLGSSVAYSVDKNRRKDGKKTKAHARIRGKMEWKVDKTEMRTACCQGQ